MSTRWTIVSDDLGQEYIVPVDKVDAFYEWVDTEDGEFEGDLFVIDGHRLTFEKPEFEV